MSVNSEMSLLLRSLQAKSVHPSRDLNLSPSSTALTRNTGQTKPLIVIIYITRMVQIIAWITKKKCLNSKSVETVSYSHDVIRSFTGLMALILSLWNITSYDRRPMVSISIRSKQHVRENTLWNSGQRHIDYGPRFYRLKLKQHQH
jgi:hypothetical protein